MKNSLFTRSIIKLSLISFAVFVILTGTVFFYVYAQYDGVGNSNSNIELNDSGSAASDVIDSSAEDENVADTTAVFFNDNTVIRNSGLYYKDLESLGINSLIKNSEHVEQPTTNQAEPDQKESEQKQASSEVSSGATGNKTIDGQPVSYTRILNMTATAYTYSNNAQDITASGAPVQVGIIAADFSVIPMNTRVYIAAADGSWVYGYAIVGDTGVKGNVIDLFMTTESQCMNFGVQNAVVYILD